MSSFLKKIKEKIKIQKANSKKINLFMVYHKPSTIYKSNIITPIHAGRDVAFTAAKDGAITVDNFKWLEKNMIGDNTGDNISTKNRFYCETTVTYWMWKNCPSPIVGLMHYRRIFDFRELGNSQDYSDVMKKYCVEPKIIKKLLSEYDMILPAKLDFGELSIYQQYAKYCKAADLDMAMNIIKEKYPEMSPYVDKLKEQKRGYFYNMFIMRKELFNEYAEFMFNVLFELSRRIPDRSSRNLYQQRIEGFIAERIANVFFNYLVNERGLFIKEVPVVQLNPENPVPKLTFKKSSRPKSLTIYIKLRF